MPIVSGGAGGSGSGFASLFDSGFIAAPAATIDATGIGATSSHLFIFGQVRSTVAAVLDNVLVTFNGDTGANYAAEAFRMHNTTVLNSAAAAGTSMELALCPGATAAAGAFSSLALWVPNYTSTTKQKAPFGINSSMATTAATTDNWVDEHVGLWSGTAAITRVTFSLTTGPNFATGSRIQVLGFS